MTRWYKILLSWQLMFAMTLVDKYHPFLVLAMLKWNSYPMFIWRKMRRDKIRTIILNRRLDRKNKNYCIKYVTIFWYFNVFCNHKIQNSLLFTLFSSRYANIKKNAASMLDLSWETLICEPNPLLPPVNSHITAL